MPKQSNISQAAIRKFQKKIWDFYRQNRRNFPWRRTTTPYRVFVSEVMLQQTQTERVREKYKEFLKTFPNFKVLSEASLGEVLHVWQGLGYNRRARFLLESARKIMREHHGFLPRDESSLRSLPGIGPGTAGSLIAFVFDQPVVFIETNIRRVFIHEFCFDRTRVPDSYLRDLIEETLPQKNIREWYYALMDYGAYLGKILDQNPNSRSRHYSKQSPFIGSEREARGAVVKFLLEHTRATEEKLTSSLPLKKQKIHAAIRGLEKEAMIARYKNTYQLLK